MVLRRCHGVLAAEKAPFWLEITARGTPGHGSARDDSAPNRRVEALEKIRNFPLPLTVTPVVERYFRAIAPTVEPELRPLYANVPRAIADRPRARSWRRTCAELFNAITTVARRHEPGARIVPLVSTGFTDSHYFMELGMTCYGFAPFRLAEAEALRLHGNDERLSIDYLREGQKNLWSVLWPLVAI